MAVNGPQCPPHYIQVGLEHKLHFCQWVISAVKGHPVLKKTVELIVKRAESGLDQTHEGFVHAHTGPGNDRSIPRGVVISMLMMLSKLCLLHIPTLLARGLDGRNRDCFGVSQGC